MLTEEIAAVREDDRVTRLFPGRARELSEVRADAPVPSNDIGRGLRHPLLSADLRARLDDNLEQRLRAPFSHIRTMTAVLRDETTERRAEQLDEIARAAERGEAMLNDMLAFLRSAAGAMPIARRRVDLKVLCERVVDAIHIANPDRAMMFTSDSRVEGLWDPDEVAVLVTRLLVNAIEHGPARPAVRVELHGRADEAILVFWNAGAIVHPDWSRKLFEPFACGRLRRTAGPEGLGLGLYLAREIASAHGGRIDVQSSDADGTTFRVTLPRC
jgi:signal transduction histidine kinase